jgi:hypothetical protein
MDWDTFTNLQNTSNLLGALQRQKNLQQQQEVISLLEQQKRDKEQEQKRLDALAACPLCKEKVQSEALVCKHCHATLFYIPEFLSEQHFYFATKTPEGSAGIAMQIKEKAEHWRESLDSFSEELLAKYRTILDQRAKIAKVCYARKILLRNKIFVEMIVQDKYDRAYREVHQNFRPIEVSEETQRSFAFGNTLIAAPIIFILAIILFATFFEYQGLNFTVIAGLFLITFLGAYATYLTSIYQSRGRSWLSKVDRDEAIKSVCHDVANRSVVNLKISEVCDKPVKELFEELNAFQKDTNNALAEAKKIYEYTKPKIEYLQALAERAGCTLHFDYEECDFLFYTSEFCFKFDAKVIDEKCWSVWKQMTWVDEGDYPGRFLKEVDDTFNQCTLDVPNEPQLADEIVGRLRTLEEEVVSSSKHASLQLAADANKINRAIAPKLEQLNEATQPLMYKAQKGLAGAIEATKEKAGDLNEILAPKINELNKAAQPFIDKAVDQAKQISAKVTEDVISRIQGNTALDDSHDDQTDDSNAKNIRINSDTPTWLLLENGRLVGPNSLGKIQQAYRNKKLPENSKLGFSENGPWRSLKPKKHPE